MIEHYSDAQLRDELKRREEEKQEIIFKFLEVVPLPDVEAAVRGWMNDRLSDDYHEDNDNDHYLVEAILHAYYGEDVYDRLSKYDIYKGEE